MEGNDDASVLAASLAKGKAAVLDLHHVDYTVKVVQKKQKVEQTVLHDVSFSMGDSGSGCGSMVAILGRSGAGKSSLLNVVSQRGTGTRTGHVLLNGAPLVRSDRLLVGYVEQGDELPPFLTPREHLLVYAALSGQMASAAERRERVELVLRVLELTRVAESRIGVLGTGRRRGLSGGERKRLAIGSALLFNPPVMCLDEYTSGLDSETAYVVTRVLRRVATLAKKLIVATIHQPSSAVYFAFDQTLLLSVGHVQYVGAPAGAVAHFASLGPSGDGRFTCPQYYNPADFLISLMAAPPPLDSTSTSTPTGASNGQGSGQGATTESTAAAEESAAEVVVEMPTGDGAGSPTACPNEAVAAARYARAFDESEGGQALRVHLEARVAAAAGIRRETTANVLLQTLQGRRRTVEKASTNSHAPSPALPNGTVAGGGGEDGGADAPAASSTAPVRAPLDARASRWTQFNVLLLREWRCSMRNPRVLRFRLIITVVLALLVGGIYYAMPLTLSGAQDRVFLLLITGAMMGVRPMIEIARLFIEERVCTHVPPPSRRLPSLQHACNHRMGRLWGACRLWGVRVPASRPARATLTPLACPHPLSPRPICLIDFVPMVVTQPLVNLEVASQMYTPLPLFIAKTIVDLPLQALIQLIFAAIMYPLCGLRAGGFIYYTLTLFITALTAQSVGLLLGASISDERAIQVAAPVLFFPVFLFSGPLSVNIPAGLAWLEDVNFYKYVTFYPTFPPLLGSFLYCPVALHTPSPKPSMALSVTFHRSLVYRYSVLLASNNEFVGLHFATGTGNATISGEEYLSLLGINDISVPVAWVVLLSVCVLLRVLAFLALSMRLRRRMA